MSLAAFFDAARALKRELSGDGVGALNQHEVDQLNAVIAGWKTNIELPDAYWPLLAQIESSNRLYALPPINPKTGEPYSSASGLYQFIKSTWQGEGGQWGNDPMQAFGGLRPDANEQLKRAKSYTTKNAEYLQRLDIPINCASLYAAHFFGAPTAAKVIGSDVNARADVIAGPTATNANPAILRGKTVGQFLTWLHGKTGEWAR